jgi:hypothetical protein
MLWTKPGKNRTNKFNTFLSMFFVFTAFIIFYGNNNLQCCPHGKHYGPHNTICQCPHGDLCLQSQFKPNGNNDELLFVFILLLSHQHLKASWPGLCRVYPLSTKYDCVTTKYYFYRNNQNPQINWLWSSVLFPVMVGSWTEVGVRSRSQTSFP